MQINSKYQNSDFHKQLIEAAKNCDINRLIQLIILESSIADLDPITKLLLTDTRQMEKFKTPTSVVEGLKHRRKLVMEGSHA